MIEIDINERSMRNESENSMEEIVTGMDEMVTLHNNDLALWRHAANSDDNVNVGFTINLHGSGTYPCPNVAYSSWCVSSREIWFELLGQDVYS